LFCWASSGAKVNQFVHFSGSADDHGPVKDYSVPLKDLPMPTGWNTSHKFLRPRIFCLEHGVQIEELLQSKGGANLLIICHSGEMGSQFFCSYLVK
jgi:hypothetical protein